MVSRERPPDHANEYQRPQTQTEEGLSMSNIKRSDAELTAAQIENVEITIARLAVIEAGCAKWLAKIRPERAIRTLKKQSPEDAAMCNKNLKSIKAA